MASSHQALLVIDMQREFRDRNPSAFTGAFMRGVQSALADARSNGMLVVHIGTQYSPDKSDWPLAWQSRDELWCMKGTAGAEWIEEVTPLPTESVIVKTRYSAFYETGLDRLLRLQQVERVLFCGYASDVCVRFSAVDAYNRNYLVEILADCVASEREDPRYCLDYLRRLTNAVIRHSPPWSRN